MVKWGWVLAAIAAVLIVGCSSSKPRKKRILDDPSQFGETIEEEPETFSAEDHVDTAMIYYHGGKLKEAEAQFQMALKQKPDLPEAHCGIGYVYHFMAFMQIQAQKPRVAIDYHQKAAGHFLEALKKKPKMVEALVGLAMVNFDEYYYFVPHTQEYRIRATGYLDRARATAPKDQGVQANCNFQDAKFCLSEKGYAEAKRLLEDVVDSPGLDPMSKVQAHYMLAGCYVMTDDKERAIDQYRLYLKAFPNASDAQDVNDIIVKLQESMATPHQDGGEGK